MATAAAVAKQVDFAHWMERAAGEIDRVLPGLAPDPVHDLRVALRRCRSVASSFRMIDFHPAWRGMDRAARTIFRQLGELRDVQVLADWAKKLGAEDDPVTAGLVTYCGRREAELRGGVVQALARFNRQRWTYWSTLLTDRVRRVPVDGAVFRVLALHRFQDAYGLHQQALKNRTKKSYHALRIGLKKFRYIVENFLPGRHQEWGGALKKLQDLLGEVHDLDVLWATALRQKLFPDLSARERWRERVEAERAARIERYRRMMVGPDALWNHWERGLPQGNEVRSAEHERLRTWAAFLDRDLTHSERVQRFALQIARSLPKLGLRASRARFLEQVRAAALMHAAGNSPKKTRRLIERVVPPIGWTEDEMKVVALGARHYRGALPNRSQKRFATLTRDQQRTVQEIAAVLRLADALDRDHSGSVKRIALRETEACLTVQARGFNPTNANGQAVAAGRYLLESICGEPVLVRAAGGVQRAASSRISTRYPASSAARMRARSSSSSFRSA